MPETATTFEAGDRIVITDGSTANGLIGTLIKYEDGQWTIKVDQNTKAVRWWYCTSDEMKPLIRTGKSKK